MEELIFDCQVITPMFLYGADGKTPELRPPSIKGAMRFWWRAIQAEGDINRMKKKEARIFGDSSEEGRSSFSVIVTKGMATKWGKEKMLPHHTGDRNCPYLPVCGKRNDPGCCSKGKPFAAITKQNFQVKLRYYNLPDYFPKEKLEALFRITSCLGGLGRRSRRGFGSFLIEPGDSKKIENLDDILDLLNVLENGKFFKGGDSIKICKECSADYPFIKEVKIGRQYATPEELLKTIAIASHNASVEYKDKSLGSVRGGRLASPVYVSVIKSGEEYRPVISTLNMALKNGAGEINSGKQEFFKEAIL